VQAEPKEKEREVHTLLGIDTRTWVKYRYHLVGVAWIGSMAGSLAWTFSQKHMKFSQKLIQARVYAQFMTIGSLLATAYLTTLPGLESDDDEDQVRTSRF